MSFKTPENSELMEDTHWTIYPIKRFYSLAEAAVYCALSEISLKQAYYRGELPCIRRGVKSKLIFDVQDLDSFMLKDKQQHKAVDTRMRARNGRFKKQ